MKHFDEKQWEVFHSNQRLLLQREEMEEHLLHCQECMDLYLEVAQRREDSTPAMPKDFLNKVVTNTRIVKKQQNLQLFRYYAAAACLTLLLTSKGFFSLIPQEVPKVMERLDASQVKIKQNLQQYYEKQNNQETINNDQGGKKNEKK